MTLLQLLAAENGGLAFEFLNRLSPKFFMRLGVNLATIFLLLRFVYLPSNRNREHIFTYFIFNILIFLITFLLNKVDMSMGAAFGLFAVFSMLRYRTENISIKDMTYLFLSIAIGLIMAVSKGSWDEFVILGLIILVITYLLEKNVLIRNEASRQVMYEKVELIRPENRAELIADLEQRLGVKINRVHVDRVDFLRDTALLHVYYYD
jgi:hypothetical protein